MKNKFIYERKINHQISKNRNKINDLGFRVKERKTEFKQNKTSITNFLMKGSRRYYFAKIKIDESHNNSDFVVNLQKKLLLSNKLLEMAEYYYLQEFKDNNNKTNNRKIL